jgi:chemotaxis signal transduction protein
LEVEEENFELPPGTLDSKARELIRGICKLSDRLMHVLDTGAAVSVAGEGQEKTAQASRP